MLLLLEFHFYFFQNATFIPGKERITESGVDILWHSNTLLHALSFPIPKPLNFSYFLPTGNIVTGISAEMIFSRRKPMTIIPPQAANPVGEFQWKESGGQKHLVCWALVWKVPRFLGRCQGQHKRELSSSQRCQKSGSPWMKPASHQLDVGCQWEKRLYTEFEHPVRGWTNCTQCPHQRQEPVSLKQLNGS